MSLQQLVDLSVYPKLLIWKCCNVFDDGDSIDVSVYTVQNRGGVGINFCVGIHGGLRGKTPVYVQTGAVVYVCLLSFCVSFVFRFLLPAASL